MSLDIFAHVMEGAVEKVRKAAGNICPGWAEKGVYQIINAKILSQVLTVKEP